MTQNVKLGKSDVVINPIGLGANAVGGHNIYPNLDEEVGKSLIQTGIENRLDFIDTAYGYGNGRSEELIGQVLTSMGNRSEVVLATKAAQTVIDGEAGVNNSPTFLKQAVDDSLKRLQTDYIDLFYIHFPDEKTPKDEAVGALKELKDAGKIRAIGISNFSPEQVKEANKDGYVDVLQGHYNLLKRDAETDYFPYTVDNNITFIPYFPFASGILAGKYSVNSTFEDFRSDMPHYQGDQFKQILAKVDQLKQLAADKNTEVAHIVLAWYLKHDAIDAVIPGAKRPEQVINNLKALKVTLTDNEFSMISNLFAK